MDITYTEKYKLKTWYNYDEGVYAAVIDFIERHRNEPNIIAFNKHTYTQICYVTSISPKREYAYSDEDGKITFDEMVVFLTLPDNCVPENDNGFNDLEEVDESNDDSEFLHDVEGNYGDFMPRQLYINLDKEFDEIVYGVVLNSISNNCLEDMEFELSAVQDSEFFDDDDSGNPDDDTPDLPVEGAPPVKKEFVLYSTPAGWPFGS
jgi:hypothetical protein